VWDSENFYLNEFLAYNSIPLIDIIDGPMQHTVQMFPYVDNFQQGKLNSVLNLKINLSEIWDFKLDFMDWKTTSLVDIKKPSTTINPAVQLEINSKQSITPSTKSSKLDNNFLPYWAKVGDGIVFRGTYNELK